MSTEDSQYQPSSIEHQAAEATGIEIPPVSYNGEHEQITGTDSNENPYSEVERFDGDRPYMAEASKYRDKELENLKNQYTSFAADHRNRPVFNIEHTSAQVVALSPLVKAYARFTSEQTLFLETGAAMSGEQYQQALWRYSKEQTALIRAQAEALRQAGIL